MKIQIMSDLHLEFDWHSTGQAVNSFINTLDPTGVDVLVLAGDICVHKHMVDVMSMICRRYKDSEVIWVHGNHEYYGSNRELVIEKSNTAVAQNKNLRWLNNSAVTIKNQRFIGSTMWFKQHPDQSLEYYLNDFRVIDRFKSWVYAENSASANLLGNFVSIDDIVITHHLPSFKSVAKRFTMNDLNCFYVNDMENDIKANGPKLWIHGHTHNSLDYNIEHNDGKNSTRVLCNPRGYNPDAINPEFNPNLVIEV